MGEPWQHRAAESDPEGARAEGLGPDLRAVYRRRRGHVAALVDQHVVEQRAIAILNLRQLVAEIGEVLDVIPVDLRVVGDVLRLVAVVRRAVPAAGESRLREAGAAQVAPQHEGDRTRDVAFEGQSHEVVHQLIMEMLALRQSERNVTGGFLCRVRHGESLDGVSAPALTDARFIERWREGPLDSLYSFIRQTMPFGRVAAAGISDSDYLDILVHILNVNQYPVGRAELKPDALIKTMFVGKNGPQPVPDGAHVLAVGCLNSANDQWSLSRATEPIRTPTIIAPNPSELKASAEKKTGALTFRLTDLEAVPDFSPAAHNGHKVQVKGFLTRQPNAERISVTAIDMRSVYVVY